MIAPGVPVPVITVSPGFTGSTVCTLTSPLTATSTSGDGCPALSSCRTVIFSFSTGLVKLTS